MAKFYVGQRVRLIKPVLDGVAGLEGRVEAFGLWPVRPGFREIEATVRCLFPGPYGSRVCADWQIEPITPPHVSGSWEVIEQLLPNIREGVAA